MNALAPRLRAAFLLASGLVASGAAAAGCASVQGEGYFDPAYDLAKVQRIAIVDGNNPVWSAGTRQSIMDSLQFEFFRRGWTVVERSNLDQAVAELNFQGSDLASPDERKALGHILNVQAIALVNIGAAGKELSITAKLFDVETGNMIWMGSGEGSVNAGLSTTAGALGGAVIGGAIGHNTGRHAGTGAVIGAVAGGALGNSMSPGQLENAKNVVKKVAETLPAR